MSGIKRFRIIKWKKDRPVLSAKSISKSYGRKMVLRKIDLELQRGEMLGFLGSNGAGKSTFMSIVLGLQKSDYGDVFLGSKKITSLPIHTRAQMGIGFLPQQSSIFRGSMTVFDNVLKIYNNVSLNYPTGTLQADKIDYNFETKYFKVSMFDDKSVKMKVLK